MENQKYTISHTEKGFNAIAKPGKELATDVYTTFSSTVVLMGYLVKLNETIDGAEWIKRIEKSMKDSARRKRMINAIKLAMDVLTDKDKIMARHGYESISILQELRDSGYHESYSTDSDFIEGETCKCCGKQFTYQGLRNGSSRFSFMVCETCELVFSF